MNINNINYSEMTEETQLFINKAIELYTAMRDRCIQKTINHLGKEHLYVLTNSDKKVLALFMAGFLVDGNLKEILNQYDDLNLEKLLGYVGIKESDVKPLADGNYEEFFDKNFKLDLVWIIKEGNRDSKINFITPENIVRSLQFISNSGVKVLDYLADECDLIRTIIFNFSSHPLFKALDSYTRNDGSVSILEKEKTDGQPGIDSMIFDIILSDIDKQINKENTRKAAQKTAQQPEKKKKKFKIDDSVWEILDGVLAKFIGQEKAAEGLFYNIINNLESAEEEEVQDGERSIIFLDGPTGTGKTAIVREITKKLGMPFSASSVKNYSGSGYVGGNITDTLRELYIKANGDLELAQKGIIVLDEIDKISYAGDGELKMKREVQQQLLDFLGGGKYTINVGSSPFDSSTIDFDTSKLTFICLGALTDLRQAKISPPRSIGFGETTTAPAETEGQEYSISPLDLMSMGLERELVGRFNTYLHTEDYSMDTLKEILTKSPISPLIGFRKLVERRGKKLVLEDGIEDLIAKYAYELNTGARSLQTIMNTVRTLFLKEILRGPSDVVTLDSDVVTRAVDDLMKRKGRR